jgi:hypothetical protein
VRIVALIGVLIAALFTGSCTIFQKEMTNRGGYLDYVLDQHWFKADSKRMRALRAFAIQVSLARIASVSPKNDSDRKVLSIRTGSLTQKFLQTVYACALLDNPLNVPGAVQDPCFYYDSAMVEYSSGLFDLAMVALPVDDAKNLVNAVSGTISTPNPLAFGTLLNALLVIGRDALTYGRIVGGLYRDTIELEVQLWLATPRIDNRPPPYRVTDTTIKPLADIYARGNDDMPSWIEELAALRSQGLEPFPDPKFFAELNGLMNYICDQISKDPNPPQPATSTAVLCKVQLPATVTTPATVMTSSPVHVSTVTAAPVVVAPKPVATPVVVAPKPVTPPVAKPAAIPSTLAANEQARNILREYLKVGGNPFDSTRTKNLQQSLDKIHDKAVQAAGGDLPLLPIIVQNTEYASVRQMLVQQACSDKLFQQVPNDTILASACPTGGQQ